MPEIDEHLEKVMAFGEEVSAFLLTDVGQYLLQCADKEHESAANLLQKVAPWRTRRIRDLQNQCWRAGSVKGWLNDAISAGEKARTILEEGSD